MDFEVDRDDLHRTRVVRTSSADLTNGEARLRIDAFALTSNNISYAAFGDMLRYWDFFPASTPDPSGGDPSGGNWGRVPVWGFADVLESTVAELAIGRRVYGYWPMSTELVVESGRFDDRGFTDMAAHRQAMAGAYNRYVFADADPIHRPDRERQQMVLWPLFFTSFVVDDFIADNDAFGASTVVLSSASSKTAIGAASLLADRDGLRVVGLTSGGNSAFVRELGCYDETVTYDELGSLGVAEAVFVDFAGNVDVRAAVHERFGDHLRSSMVVGGTHWDHETEASAPTVGPKPAFFFAPTQIAKRSKEWGREALDERVGAAWHRYSTWTDGWIRFEESRGPEAVETAYRNLLDGRADPRLGAVCSMEES